ncbi:MAG: carbohydrate porin, partial [Verrucomicrobia bacterium]|nr:carbohydrate porin [Verrucomicrobiota bacterium]
MSVKPRNFRTWLLCSCLAGSPAKAQTEADVAAELRQELKALHNDYEQRIAQLEARIRDLEKHTPPAPQQATPPARHRPPAKPKPHEPKPSPAAAPAAPPVAHDPSAGTAAASMSRQARERFGGDTETRDLAPQADAAKLLDKRIEDILEGYLDISGYFRAGYGRSDEDGPQRAFGLPGVSKYRLGNEAENYGEINFAKTFFKPGAFTPGGHARQVKGLFPLTTGFFGFTRRRTNVFRSSTSHSISSPFSICAASA